MAVSASASPSITTHRYSPSAFPASFPHSLASLSPHDPSPDHHFYTQPRFVHHIDDHAVAQLTAYYARVLPRASAGSEALPRVLDICSSWVSHIPLGTAGGNGRDPQPSAREVGMQVVGVGMNAAEMGANRVLSEWVVHDLNRQPDFLGAIAPERLQRGRASAGAAAGEGTGAREMGAGGGGGGGGEGFDAVICNVSIDYLTRPLEVMRAVADALKPGGEGYMAVSNRCFPTKVRP